ncbi:MAG: hypothetical protein GY862_07470 [Gammaproteobacteria bacterium]|nr:hypothetical protein [Gammaproteobacteria bacterium]
MRKIAALAAGFGLALSVGAVQAGETDQLPILNGVAGNEVQFMTAGDMDSVKGEQASFAYMPIIFDPFLEPAPAGICADIGFGNIQCDWSGVSAYTPGIHMFTPLGW